MRKTLTKTGCWLGMLLLAVRSALAQGQPYDREQDLQRIRDAYAAQKRAAVERAERISSVVREQLDQTHDKQEAEQMFKAWAAANDVRLENDRQAAEQAAQWRAAQDEPSRAAAREALRQLLDRGQKLENVQQTIERGLTKHVDPGLLQEVGVGPQVAEGGPAAPAAASQVESEAAPSPSEIPHPLDLDRVQHDLADNLAYQQAQQVLERLEAANAGDLEGGIQPGLPAGTLEEGLLAAIDEPYDGRAQQAMQAAATARQMAHLMQRAAELNRRIQEHNDRYPSPPVFYTQEEVDQWNNTVVYPYNQEAEQMNAEASALQAEFDALLE